MASKIGIKLADGTFFPVMDEDSSTFETLELTTVRDEQQSVQINLFKKEDSSDPQYIGSLVVEDIQQKQAGEATIALKLSLDEEKRLSAEALDVDSGTRQELEVSLKTFDESGFDIVDFDLYERTDGAEDTDEDMNSEFSTALFYTDEEEEEKKRGMPVWLIVLLVLLGVAALVLAVLLLNKKAPDEIESQTSGTTIIEKEPAAAVEPAESGDGTDASADAVAVTSDEPELPADTPTNEPPTPNESETGMAEASKFVAATDPEPVAKRTPAVRYKVRWGDTLWDLSETYYRNPWLYKKIADYNNLKNPDIIVSGTYIEIPPQ